MRMPDARRPRTLAPAIQEAVLGRVVVPAQASGRERAVWQLALLFRALLTATERHPDWTVVRHEALCQSPQAGFAQLAAAVGLPPDPAVPAMVDARNRVATGYTAARVAANEVGKWRTELGPPDVDLISRVLDGSGLSAWIEPA